MNRIVLTGIFCLIIANVFATPAAAENRVWIESVTAGREQNYVEIHVFLQNDIPISGVVVPLIMESKTGGAFVNSIELSFSERLSTFLTDYTVRNQYDVPDGICGIICDTIPDSVCDTSRGFRTFNSTSGRHEVPSSPHGLYFVRARFDSPLLPAGTDATGSLVISANIGSNEGTFTIDSTCTDPNNHLMFIDAAANRVDVSFQPATITVQGACCGRYSGGLTGNTDCDPEGKRNLADITRLIDRVYLSRKLLCCDANGNVDGDPDGKLNLADITKLIDNVYLSKAPTAACP